MTEPVTEDGIESAWNACKYRGYCSRLHVENADVMVERDRLRAEVERLRAELERLTKLRPACDHNNATLVLAMYRQGTQQRLTRHLEPWEEWLPLPDVKETK